MKLHTLNEKREVYMTRSQFLGSKMQRIRIRNTLLFEIRGLKFTKSRTSRTSREH
jgi:hypothetical protein